MPPRRLDPDTLARLRDDASKPLAPFDRWTWGEIQLFDNGEAPPGARSYVRYKLKVRHSLAPAAHLVRVESRYRGTQPER